MNTRMEHDTMGEIAVPAEHHWGAQTQRSLENFKIGGQRQPQEIITATEPLKQLLKDELAKEGLPVFVGPTLGSKSKAELRHKSFTTPGTLYKAGLTVSIITDAPVIPLEKLPMCAGLAADAGLPMDEAWRAITINPARSLGIDSRVGSLEPGKDADFVLWTADPLTTIGGQAYMTVIDGRIVYQAE